MARTKQTARYSTAGKAPRKQLAGKGVMFRGRGKGKSKAQNESDSEQQVQKVNLNQFSVKFDNQDECEKKSIKGNIINCKNCSAILNSQSQLISHAAYDKMKKSPDNSDAKRQKYLNKFEQVWVCEFCLCHNSIQSKEKIPQQEDPCYIIQNPKKNSSKKEDNSEKWIIFCVDISGSMDMVVQGKSRLESVKEAISEEVKRMKFEKENVKVGLVTFGSKVSFLTTKNNKTIELPSQCFNNFTNVLNECKKIGEVCHSIDSYFKNIQGKIHDLCTYGSTALGPALLSSIQIASKGPAGSKIVICTDGQANVGIGASFTAFSVNKPIGEDNFYSKAADYAKNKNVVVSILSLKGDRCNLKELGKLSLATGGSLLKIDPKRLGTEFSKITKEEMLGTQTFLTIKVNNIFEIQQQNTKNLSKDKTTLHQHLGNFSADTEITFSFKVLSEEEAKNKKDVDMQLFKRPKVPMQIQMSYTGRNGGKYMQVITDWRLLTEDKTLLYEGMNFGLFSASTLQNVSNLIRAEKFEEAQKVIFNYYANVEKRFIKSEKKQEITKFNTRVQKLENVLRSKQAKKSGNKKISKSKKVKKPKLTKKSCKSKGKGVKFDVNESSSDDQQDNQSVLSSDNEEQVLVRELRARSRSRSRSRSPPAKKKR